MDIQAIKEEVLQKIKPTDSMQKTVQGFIQQIEVSIKKCNIQARVTPGGSLAKQTNLKNDFDCDLFIRFNYDAYQDKEISQQLIEIVKDMGIHYDVVHGSREYIQTEHEGITYELVPVLYIENPEMAKNVTDMSPLHVTWFQKHKKEHTCDDIRLLKQFCKAKKVYGAESYIGGLSGHILDIMIIYYGSFEKTLQAIVNWDSDEKIIIDPEQKYTKETILDEMNESKIYSPLIIVDPVLPERNAASALTKVKLQILQNAVKQFLAHPSVDDFVIVPYTKENFTEKNGAIFSLQVTPKKGKKDVVGAKFVKALEYIVHKAAYYGFTILDAKWEWQKEVIFFFCVEQKTLAPTQEIRGPPLKIKGACSAFKDVHTETFEKDGRLYAVEKTPFTEFSAFLETIVHDAYVKERVEKIM